MKKQEDIGRVTEEEEKRDVCVCCWGVEGTEWEEEETEEV